MELRSILIDGNDSDDDQPPKAAPPDSCTIIHVQDEGMEFSGQELCSSDDDCNSTSADEEKDHGTDDTGAHEQHFHMNEGYNAESDVDSLSGMQIKTVSTYCCMANYNSLMKSVTNILQSPCTVEHSYNA